MNRRDVLKLASVGPTIAPAFTTSGIAPSPTMDAAEYHLCIYGRGKISHFLIATADDVQFATLLDDELKQLRQSILDYRDKNREALVNGRSS